MQLGYVVCNNVISNYVYNGYSMNISPISDRPEAIAQNDVPFAMAAVNCNYYNAGQWDASPPSAGDGGQTASSSSSEITFGMYACRHRSAEWAAARCNHAEDDIYVECDMTSNH
ncbi:hypothetical protein HXX76_012360 [Chlamydomonas incerta]|uniref:Uncharacterized protein n=1 Tax=Chlamydomonas incerta TaxID=51695 RepID=A0A835VVV9_CHLIN|nr:hypothetical protein HXX76_012360 [Chlamydomonas incerta]|eukprot:KAG2427424.1 hypothetical protein HXX76_012360 [Chlamydomonas incerta]